METPTLGPEIPPSIGVPPTPPQSVKASVPPTLQAPGPGDWLWNSHSGWHERLELPLLLLTVQEKPVHDLVLLLRGDEVLNN